MQQGKGVGGDKVNIEKLENGVEKLWQNLHALLQRCWEEEYIPDDWVEGIIVSLHNGGDETNMGNYHGIILVSHMRELLCPVLKN